MIDLLMRRREMIEKNKESVIFELYNQYFDGTASGVVNTGIKLWDGNHNKFKFEVVYDQIPGRTNLTLFACRPDYNAPYSGIRLRSNNEGLFGFTISESTEILENGGGFSLMVNNYGHNYNKNYALEINTLTVIRDDDIISWDYNGLTAEIKMSNVKTNNLNFLIGCDYKSSNNQTQRYYTGTVHKFIISEF